MTFRQFMAETRFCWPITSFYGFLKGVLICVPGMVGCTLACLAVAGCFFPKNLYRALCAILFTKKVGPTIKVLLVPLLLVTIVLATVLLLIALPIVSFCYALFRPLFSTFMAEDNFFISGLFSTLKDCFYEFPKTFAKYWGAEIPTGLKEFETAELKEGEEPFDVKFWWLFFGFFYAFAGFVVDAVAGFGLGLIHFLPGTGKAYYKLWKLFFEVDDVCLFVTLFLPFVAANALLAPIAVLTAFLVLPIGGALAGLTAAGAAYNRGFAAGFQRIANNIYEMDKMLCRFIYETEGCLQPLHMGEDLC